MKTLYKNWLTLLLIASMALIGSAAKATHLMGADLTYECLGGNTYRITLTLYRDCIGIAAPSSCNITVKSATCSQNTGLIVYPRPGTGQEVTPACSSSVTTCRGGSFTGIQEWIYDGIITLPMQCADWTFAYNPCCRNAAITNILNPSGSTFYIYATLNNLATTCNNSPTFSNKPVPFLCRGQNYCFNHGVYDADGDSITFELITPKQTASTNVMYAAPFTASNPLTSSPATTFNNQTGDICMTPQNLEVTVMAVLVKEYRNGVLIGSVERDLQLTVMTCANNLPSLTGINGTNNFSMTVCANQPACFNIYSNDPDNGQHLTVSWDQAIAGASFTTTSAAHPTATFCWTPTSADIGNTYFFTAMVSDDACPYIGSQIYSYSITVTGLTVNLGPDQSIACSDLATLNASASGGTPPYTYLWNNGSTMQAITVGTGTWTVTATDGQCSASDTITIDMPYIPVAGFSNPSGSCANSPIPFNDQSTTPGGIIYSWFWNFGDGTNSFDQFPTHQFPAAGSYTVALVIENTLGCTDTVMNTVVIDPLPVASFNVSNGCVNTPLQLTNLNPNSASSWHWDFGDGSSSSSVSATHTYTSPGNYTITLTGTTAGGCVDSVSQVVHIYQLPNANAGADVTTCLGTSVTLNASGGNNFSWIPGGSGQSMTVNPMGTTNYVVQVTNQNGCSAYDTVAVVVNPVPAINAGPDQTICRGTSATLTASGGNSYSWSPGNGTGSSLTVSPNNPTTYTVTGTNAYGCSSSDAVTVNVNSNPTANAGSDMDLCAGGTATLTASGGTAYNWILTGETTSSITVNPLNSTQYTVIVTDANGCTDADIVQVNVHTPPSVNLQSIFLCTGAVATLDAGIQGVSYVWSPSGATSQSITINAAGNYGVTVTDNFGCTAAGSAVVTSGNSLSINLNNVSFCQGDSVVLDPGYPGLTYLWSPGGQTTQTLTVTAPGNYGVTVTDASGCSGSVNVTAQVNANPVALFNAGSVCNGAPTNFTDASAVGGSTITNWNWNFGDGAASMQQNPSHQYNGAGNYTVNLTVTSLSGCVASYSSQVTVNPLPVAAFTAQDACVGSAVSFINSSTVSGGNITSHEWSFGDGAVSSQASPSHSYSSAGSYTVQLTVTTAGGCQSTITHQVTVFPAPSAVISSTVVCQGSASMFSNTSSITTGQISSYVWDFGDGTISTQTNPSHMYANGGTFTANLIVTSNHGCRDTASTTVLVHASPAINAGPDQQLCPGSSLNLTATGGVTYTWMPGNLTGSSITIAPSVSTPYSVTGTDAYGCSASDQVNINLLNLPLAIASADATICAGQSTTLTGSGGNAMTWMPGGATSGTITVNPTVSTSYILTVTDQNGCQDQDTVNITVNALPSVNAGPDQTVCSGSAVALQATGASSYSWTPGGSTNPTLVFTPSTSSTYIVTGASNQGCINRDTVDIIVNQSPLVNLPPTFICQGFSATLNAGNPGSTYQWSTGESTQTIAVSDSGLYSVVVISNNGCAASGNTTVTVGGTMQSMPSVNSICSGQSVVLNAGNPGSTYTWSNGATTQTISVNTAGNYLVTVADPNGCTATLAHVVTVNPLPVPLFSASGACLGDTVHFTDLSSVANGSIQSRIWTFGNGISSTSVNTAQVYSTSGNYTVSLTVTTDQGCNATTSSSVAVYPLPVADFSAPPVCLGNTTLFANSSTLSSGSISGWSWNLGDNTTSTASAPSHLYATAGNFNATLVITSDHGCKDTITRSIAVNGLPDVNFSVNDACFGTGTALVNNSTSSWGPIASYNWAFGDGSSSQQYQPAYTYNAAGTYQISLTATTVNGCESTQSAQVNIFPVPVAAFSAQNVCEGAPVTILNSSTIPGSSITSNYWTFENNGSSNSLQPSPLFSSDGQFQITLVTTSSDGCKDTASHTVTIYPEPVASFSTTNACLNNATTLNNTSTVSSGTITTWHWDFGDNNTSSVQQASHTYTTSGTYTVNLNITSDHGCTNSSSAQVNVFPNPVAAFSTGNVCFGMASPFINQSDVPGGSTFNSVWNFSDGSTSLLNDPTVTFQSAGTQQATLVVTTPNGCSDQITQTLTVYNPPVAGFSGANNCQGLTTQFNDLSTSQSGSIVAWAWDFGDGQTSTESDPDHLYANAGNYAVTLLTTTEFGCTDTTNGNVQIYRLPEPAIQGLNACAGSTIQFTGSSSGTNGPVSYLWEISNGVTSTDSSFNQLFSDAGNYQVQVTATTAEGCSGSQQMQLEIYPQPVPVFSSLNVCLNTNTAFTNNTTITNGSIAGYSWTFGDNQTSVGSSPLHQYSAAGNYQVTLTASSNHGCTASSSGIATVYNAPTVDFTTGVQGCSPLLSTPVETSSVTDGSIAGWLWDFGDGNISTEQRPSHIYTNSGTYTVSLTVVSNHGCQSHQSVPGFATVFPGPTADFEMSSPTADEWNPTISFTNLSHGYNSFQWSFGDGTTNSTDANPVHHFASTGTYSAMLVTVNDYGCKDTAFKSVDITPKSTLYAPNCFTPNGDGKNDFFKPEFTNMSNIQVEVFDRWGLLLTSWDGLDGSWDGYYKGNKCETDTYVYKIKGTGIEGKAYEWTGRVSIVY